MLFYRHGASALPFYQFTEMPKSYHRRQRSISGNKYTKNTDGNNIYFGKYRFIYLPFTLITKIPFLVFTEIKKNAHDEKCKKDEVNEQKILG